MNDAEAIGFARAALSDWDLPDCIPRLIKNRENAVFEVVGPKGARAALRLHRPGYQTDDAIRSELIWTQELAKAGMQLPRPITCKNDDLISFIPKAGRMASIVSWVDGVPLGDNGINPDMDGDTQVQLYSALGSELAKLHKFSDGLALPDNFERAQLCVEGLLGDTPIWGKFWENPALTVANKELLLQTREKLLSLFNEHQKDGADFGLIHADALSENVFTQNGTVTLIDFDDGVFGFRLYELGVAMSQVWDRGNAVDLAAGLVDGYGANPQDAALIPAFTVMRTLASCGWVISRYAADDPTLIAYAARAVRASTRFMTGAPLFGVD